MALATLGLLVLGCAPRLPSASLDGVGLVGADLQAVDAELRIAVDNPLLVEVPVRAVRWSLAVSGHPLADGAQTTAPALAPNAVTVVPIPVHVAYADALGALSGAEAGAPYAIAAEVDVQTPLGLYTLPVAHEGTLPALEPPSVDVVDVGLGLDGAAVRLDLALRLTLPAGVSVRSLAWTVTSAERTLARGTAEVGPDGALLLPMWLSPTDAAAASMQAVLGGSMSAQVALAGELDTPLGAVPVAIERELELAP
jgi:hypothetical protein